MNELTSELKLLKETTLNNINNSKANNTIRAYKSDFQDFHAFCFKHGLQSLPTEPKIISIYLTYLSQKFKVSTLKRRMVSISAFHKLKGFYLDMKHPIIIENLLAIRRKYGSYQIGKKPLLINNLKSIINVIDTIIVNKLKQLRDKSLILVGFAGGFRRAELVSINFEDLEFTEEGLKINIKKSKTDQFGEGMIKGIPYFQNKMYCPVVNLKKWLEISKITTGPIFKRFSKGLSLTNKRLTDQSVALIIKEYLNLAGIDNKNFSGHSLRSGFATVAADSGADERSIMAMTGHKSSQMVRRYIKEANIFKNNALNKIKL
jgi:site-specific recombinase XerD